jgi:hypothetical protein
MLNPHYVVGFTDGEGCFSVCINRKRFSVPEVRLTFEIELREDDLDILVQIKEILKCGNIYRLDYSRYEKWRPHVKYVVASFKDISKWIIPFFRKYPLQAKKRKQFEMFCEVADMIKSKEHLTNEGVEKIRLMRESFYNRDSLDALDAHVQWGVQ